MTIRILADREPYSSYADRLCSDQAKGASGANVYLNGPPELDDPSPDFIILPAEDFLSLPRESLARSSERSAFIAYGSADLMESAFDRGCADYLREPWGPLELRARVGRLAKGKFLAEGKRLELKGPRLVGESSAIELGEGEGRLLRLLLKNAPLPVPRDTAASVLSGSAQEKRQALSHCVISLRRKMEYVESGLGTRLRAVKGFGYRFDVEICG